MKYDYYLINIPEDFPDPTERFDLAILEARERAKLWCVPCEWALINDDGENVKIRRKRN